MSNCPDCGVEVGALHEQGCDIERCALCGMQAIGCGCVQKYCEKDWNGDLVEEDPTDEAYAKLDAEIAAVGGRLPWTGTFPGEAECIEFGWYVRQDESRRNENNRGWIECSKDDLRARPNLNRLYGWTGEAEWSVKERRWILTERGKRGKL